jgi:hypothetical protein
MPANYYQDFFLDLVTLDADIGAAYSNAQSEMQSQGMPTTIFLELIFADGKISRLRDNQNMTGLPEAELRRLYPQLNGLFRKASLALLMP